MSPGGQACPEFIEGKGERWVGHEAEIGVPTRDDRFIPRGELVRQSIAQQGIDPLLASGGLHIQHMQQGAQAGRIGALGGQHLAQRVGRGLPVAVAGLDGAGRGRGLGAQVPRATQEHAQREQQGALRIM